MTETTPITMAAVYLTGYGDLDRLEYRTDVLVPTPGPNDVLIRVSAAGVNNTDINTRTGWYSRDVTQSSGAAADTGVNADSTSGWSGDLQFPRIQGADVCGHIVAVGGKVSDDRIGERVLVSTMQTAHSAGEPFIATVFGSEHDGGFAQFTLAHTDETHAVNCGWSDVELASIPCAYSTAENMLHRIELGAEHVLITGASGGVGSAAVQLAKRRGAHVTAVAGATKADAVRELGADLVVHRNTDLVATFGENSFDVVVDVVAGPVWEHVTRLLRIGGRYISAGAIAGPIVDLDVRDLYLKDLTLKGSTYQDPEVFPNLIGYIERGEIRPMIAATYPLDQIATAQTAFLAKDFVGKIVLEIPE